MNNSVKIYWAFVLATLVLYLTMVLWSLPYIAGEASGLLPFDLRLTGYNFQDAQAFLEALSDQGTHFYLTTQRALDSLFPCLLAITLVWTFWRFLPRKLAWPLIFFAVLGGLFDLAENAAVADLLRTGPDGLTAALAAKAHKYTVLKSMAAAITQLALIALIIKGILNRVKKRNMAV